MESPAVRLLDLGILDPLHRLHFLMGMEDVLRRRGGDENEVGGGGIMIWSM